MGILLFVPFIVLAAIFVIGAIRFVLVLIAWAALAIWIAGSATVAFVLVLMMPFAFLLDMRRGKGPGPKLENPVQTEFAGTTLDAESSGAGETIVLVKNRKGVYVPR